MSAPPPIQAPHWAWLWRLLLALALGTAGGSIAHYLHFPLAWMIGAMAATTAAAVTGVQISMPMALRAIMVAVLGVMLGSGFTPEILPRLGEWAISLTALIGYVSLSGLIGAIYFQRVAGYDTTTAFFSAMPGGLSEMILVGSDLGGDGRVISLVHASRILLVVLTLPFAFQVVLGYEPATRPSPGLPLMVIPPEDLALLGLCGIAGFFGARAIRLPAAALVGPMILSAALHLSGWTRATPPSELIAAAQVVVGTAIGCRFAGIRAGFVAHTVFVAAGGTVILVMITLIFAELLHDVTGLPRAGLVLAFSPGGLAEMSLIALALSLETAFVATHHMVRIFLIVVAAPSIFRFAAKRRAAR